jgi:hypothetical protein
VTQRNITSKGRSAKAAHTDDPGPEPQREFLLLDGSATGQPADGVASELGAVSEAELLEDVGAVPFHGFDADGQQASDVVGGVAFGDEFHDLVLAAGEHAGGEGLAAAEAVDVAADEGADDAGVEERVTSGGGVAGGRSLVACVLTRIWQGRNPPLVSAQALDRLSGSL